MNLLVRDFKDRRPKAGVLLRLRSLLGFRPTRHWGGMRAHVQAEQDRRQLLKWRAAVEANAEKRRVGLPRTASTIVQFRRAFDPVPAFLRRQAH